jgi:hypothetical protein
MDDPASGAASASASASAPASASASAPAPAPASASAPASAPAPAVTGPAPSAATVAPKQGNESIKFIPIPTQNNPEASRKRLAGCGLWLTKSMNPLNRKLIVEYLLKLSVYKFQDDPSKDFTPSGVANAVRELAESGGKLGAGISEAAQELLAR